MAFANLYQRNLPVALAGLVVGQPKTVVTGINEAATFSATLTIDNVINATLYAFVLQGVTVSYTSDGSATDEEIRDGLLADLAANIYLKDDFTGAAATSATFTVTSNYRAADVVLTESDANLSLVVDTASGVSLHPGTLALVTGFAGSNLKLGPCASGAGVSGALVHSQTQFLDRPRDHHIDEATGSQDTSGYKPGQAAGLLKQGTLWLIAETAFAPGDSLFYRVAASGAGTTLGAVRNADDGANTDELTSGYSILQYDSSANLVRVALNLD